MKTLKVSLISAVALSLTASSGFAQMSGKVSVKVPFDFNVGASTLPAGTYNFAEDRTGVVHISSQDQHKSILVLTSPELGGQSTAQPSVKFDRVSGQYMLTEINMLGEATRKLIK